MSFHRNAKLGLAGRYALVGAVEGGMSLVASPADDPAPRLHRGVYLRYVADVVTGV